MDNSPGHRARLRPLTGTRRWAAWFLALAAAAGLTGCYTLIHHPSVEAGTHSAESAQDCSLCHTEREIFAEEVSPWVSYYATSSSPWINYYGAPWWTDAYWEYGPSYESGGAGTEGTEATHGGRFAWGRRARMRWSEADSLRHREALYDPNLTVGAPPTVSPGAGTPQGSQGSSSSDPEEEEPRRRDPQRSGFRR